MKNMFKMIKIFALSLFLSLPITSIAQFSGAYDPINWSLIFVGGGNGSVNIAGAPTSIVITGNNNVPSGTAFTYYQVTVATSGFLVFDWNLVHSDPGFDDFGYSVNGVNTFITDVSGTGTTIVPVNANDIFAFYSFGADGCCGTFDVTISNFSNTLTPPPPPPGPCDNTITISACGDSQTASFSGSGSWNTTACGFSTPGQEAIYSFTASATGNHTISVTSSTGGWVDYFWKTGACDQNGWVCLGDVFSAGATLPHAWNPQFSLTAGQTIYILLSPEGSGAVTQSFTVNCPLPPAPDPCTVIETIPSCGTSVTANMSGSGDPAWSLPPFGTPGLEKLYSYTPTTSGIHQINVTAATGGCWVDFFWKDASSGCNPTSWSLIQDNCGVGTFGTLNMTAGTTYYILLDPESSGSFSRTFNITCPASAPTNDLCADAITVTCGGTYTGNTTLASNTDNPAIFCGTGASTAGGVWYKFVGNGDQVTASLCGSSYDTKIFVYEGSCGNFTCVTGNDDAICGGFFTLSSEVTFLSNIGTDYYILVAGFGSSTGAFALNITCTVPPPNPCNNLTIISNCGISETATFSGNGSWNTAACGFSTFGQEYIYEFVAPTTGNYTISVTSSTGGWVDYFWKTGTCSQSGWTCLGDVFSGGAVLPHPWNPSFSLTAGQTVYILLDAEGTGSVTQTFVVNCPIPPPANDLCIDAISVTCGQAITGNTTSATSETGLPLCTSFSYNGISKGVWYVLPGNGQTAIASLCGSSYDTWINVYEGIDCNNLTCIVGNDDFCGLSSEVSFATTTGMNYYILVSGFSNSSGAFTLNLTCCNSPANDVCSAVTPVAITPGVPQTFTGNSLCSAPEGPLTLPTVWHAITTTTETNLTISYCGNTPSLGTIYIVLSTICPPSMVYPDPSYIQATSFEFASCGDGNGTILYNNLPAGTYYIPVAGAPSGPYSLSVLAECSFTASISSSQTGTCNLVNIESSASVPGNYTYSWTGLGIVNPSAQNTQAQVTSTGLYEVAISDAFGCTATASTTIEFDDGPDINLTASQTLICGTGNVQLDAGFGVSAQNGFAGAYAPGSWVFSNIPAGTGGSVNTAGAPVSVTIVSGNAGIAGTTRFEHSVLTGGNITFNWAYTTVDGASFDYPRYSINGVSTIMPGYSTSGSSSQNGTASIPVLSGQMFGLEMFTVDGIFGAGQVVISNIVFPGNLPGLAWTPAGSLSDATINAPVASLTSTETFTVVATDQTSGCTSSASVTIFVDPIPVPLISPSSNIHLCSGESEVVSTQYLAGDGYSFDWGLITTETFNVSVADNYTMYVTSPNGCISDPVSFTVNITEVVPDFSNVTDALCYGGSTGSVEIVPLGAITEPGFNLYFGPFDYSMNGGPLQSSSLFTGLAAGIYNFEIHDPVSGCFATVVDTVGEPTPLSVSANVNTNNCYGEQTATASASGSGGVGPYTITWLTPTPKAGETANEIPSGTWTVEIVDANGCIATTTITVVEYDEVIADLGPDMVIPWGSANGYTASGCTNVNASVTGGTAPYSYLWSTGHTTNPMNICYSKDTTITFTVTVTDVNGCTGTASVTYIWANIDCSNNSNGTKVTICHVPPGNPGNCQTVCIAVSAAAGLFTANPNSYLGPCNSTCPTARVAAPEITETLRVNLFPNPTSGKVTVDYMSENTAVTQILVMDVQGRILVEIPVTSELQFVKDVDLNSLENGLYMINILSNQTVISTSRVVKAE